MSTYLDLHKRYYERHRDTINERRREKAKLHQRIYRAKKFLETHLKLKFPSQ